MKILKNENIEEMCGEDGPLCVLLGGEIYCYEAGWDAIKFFY
jgi:hypothetical protein